LDYSWDFLAVFRHSDLLLEGALGTLKLSATSLAVAVPLGLIIAVMRMSSINLISRFAAAYVYFFRSSAALVLIFWFYFAFPVLVGINIDSFFAATLAISMQSAAYFGEVFRGGVLSVNKGQWEAAKSIGMNYQRIMRFIILPQAIKNMLPIFFTRIIELIKTTSLAATIAYTEIVYAASRIVSDTFRPIETFTVVALGFFVVIFGLGQAAQWFERRLAVSD
jgi:polar amino acid transport system permease protein